MVTLLKSGTQANVLFQIYDENGDPQVVGVPFSLLGFTAALNEVMGEEIIDRIYFTEFVIQ